MIIKKNDFVELQFTAKTSEGTIFDTNIAEDAKKINLKMEPRPLVICIGQGMILPAIDEFLAEKELGKYNLKLEAKKAFGERKRELVRVMPISIFASQKQAPYPGMVFQFDNMLGKISSVSGGRVIVDFNNPIAGKDVEYSLIVKRIIENVKEKIKSLMLAFFGSEIPFKLENEKLTLEVNKGFKPLFENFKPKFKEILNLELEIVEKEEKKNMQENQEEKKKEKESI